MNAPISTQAIGAGLQIAVVGGGISGLAAALQIGELLPRAKLSLFESSGRLGGILETVHRDGCLLERSADGFSTKLPAALELCQRLGVPLIPTDAERRRAQVVCRGRLVDVPEGFFLMAPRRLRPILASPVLSLAGKLRLLAEPLVPRRATAEGVADSADESVASFARRRLGRETFERLVEPLVAGIVTGDAEKLSMAATAPDFLAHERSVGSLLRAARMQARVRSSNETELDNAANAGSGARYGQFVAPEAGMGSLVEAIAARLPSGAARLSSPVARVAPASGGGWQLSIDGLVTPELFDAVILAVPAYVAARLLGPCDPALADELAAIEHASSAVVTAGYRRDAIGHTLNCFGFVVPRVEGRSIVAASFASVKYSGRAPDGQVLIRAFLGGVLHPELVDLSDHELSTLANHSLADLMQITAPPLWTEVTRWHAAMPQYHVGHLERVDRIDRLAAKHVGLTLAGNGYRGVGIPQCIASGQWAAEGIAATVARNDK